MRSRAAFFALAVTLAGCELELPPSTSAAPPAVVPSGAHPLTGVTWQVRGDAAIAGGTSYRAEAAGRSVTIEVGAASVELTTTGLRRGASDLGATAPRTRVEGDRLLMAGEHVLETWRAGAEVVEQSWRFETEPAGEGALTVTVAIDGVERARARAEGVELTSESSPILYTHGTWIDAGGTRTPIPARWAGSAITLEVPADVLARSEYPAVLDPLIGSPTAIANAIYVPDPAGHDESQVVWDGTSYSVVVGAPASIVRVSPGGRVLDVPELALPAGCSGVSPSRIVRAGARSWYFCRTRYLVIEADGTSAGWVELPAGVAADDVATDGTHILLVWSGGGADADVFAARLALDGTLRDATPLVVSSAAGPQTSPTVAWLGSTFFVAYTDRRYPESPSDVLGTRVSAEGVVASPDGQPLAASVAFGETTGWLAAGASGDHLLTFFRDTGGGNYEVHAVRLDDAGALAGLLVRIGGAVTTARPARVGGEWLIPSVQGSRVWLARFSATGEVRFESLPTFSREQREPSIATDGSSALLVWQGDTGYGSRALYGDLLRPGEPLERIALTTRAFESHEAIDLVPGGSEYLARYREGTGPYSFYPYVRRVGADGAPYGEPTGFSGMLGGGLFAPGGAGGAYALAYASSTGELGIRWLDAAGTPIGTGPTPVTIYTSAVLRGFARGPSGYLAVLSYYGGGSGIAAVRFRDDGTPIDGSLFGLTASSGQEDGPAVGGSSGGYLAAWFDDRDGADTWNVYGVRLDASGDLVDRASIPIGPGGFRAIPPRIARCGDGWVVAWLDGPSWDAQEARWAFVSAAGVPGPVTTMAGDEASPVRDVIVGWGGEHAVVLWARGTPWATTEIRGRVLDASGAAVGSDFVVANEPFTSFGSLVSNGRDDLVLAYLRTDSRDRVPRGFLRRIALDETLGTACSSASECPSGYCVDGVCCISECGGGAADDCMACSTSAGAAVDGLCGPVAAGAVCRPAAGTCDVDDLCDGTQTACSVDARVDDGVSCADDDVCDGDEVCRAGECSPGTALRCDDLDPCTRNACVPTVGCAYEPDPSCGDAGMPDAGTASDAGSGDAGSGDAGSGDAGTFDAGAEDADASAPDAAAREDAGRPSADAAAPSPDAGSSDETAAGCSCRVGSRGPATGPLAMGLAFLVGLVARRRSRRRSAPMAPDRAGLTPGR